MDQPEKEAAGLGPPSKQDVEVFIYSDLDVELDCSESSGEEDGVPGWESEECEDSEEGQIPEEGESEEYIRLEAEALNYLSKLMEYADKVVKSTAQGALQEESQDRISECKSEISVGVDFPTRSSESQADVEPASSDSGLPDVNDEDVFVASSPLPVPELVDCDSVKVDAISLTGEDDAISLSGGDGAKSLTGEDVTISHGGIGTHFMCGVKSAVQTGSSARAREEGPSECDICGKVFALERSLFFHQWRMHKAPHPKYAGSVRTEAKSTVVKSPAAKVKSPAAEVKSPPAKQRRPSKSPRAPGSPGKQGKASEEKSYACDQCDAEYKKPLSLQKHKERAPSDEKCRCEVCSRKFCERIALKVHRKSHTQTESLACKQCGRVLCNRFSLQRHMYSVHQRPNHVEVAPGGENT